ncbi:PREDICTED: putative F-box protein PP2-B12 isoform X1 [Nelumbo nucifera]|uniref:F-box protein PP2-B12 isoform X1 n=1 Tax=Nelumbo nucifera TaxID=4432 RepID=A0A1U7Z369_NELNU|nr:PREDICTED: putative F-box protein PP2-B12 isoform X1 [Nelumbo nucifera]
MEEESSGSDTRVDFYALPEGCISDIISLTSPRDACRSSAVSLVFRSVAESDVVWERFLPSDYKEILSRSDSPLLFSSKKHLFFHLCHHPILIDNGNKSFALDRCSGKKSFMIAARELSIVWGDVPQYWRWRSLPNSRFSEVAELLNVRWLEIHGRMERRMLSTATNYVAYLVLKFVEGGRGLDTQPAEASVRFVGGGGACNGPRNVFLKPNTYGQQRPSIEERLGYLRNTTQLVSRLLQIAEGQFPREREDGWMEIQMGEFFNGPGEDGEVEMSLMEVKGGHWKSGIIIQGIELRPKQSK